MLQQHQRKDSASSEVAGFLCISGRSSRISSVGSQGSAVSRLSAISGTSRSPSPHKMLVETSFCGPKPLQDGAESTSSEPATSEILEQVILSRKHDPTKVVLAEGINVDTSTPKRKVLRPIEEPPPVRNGRKEIIHKPPEVRITKPSKKSDESKLVVGVTPSGTEYYRIKLKPDHLYKDRGIASNERIVDEKEMSKKPASLNLSRESRKNEQRAIQSASPKPARHTALTKETGSRSPSPATLNISRKSSFCSLFKSNKETASPDSPTARERSRSRSKSRDNESLGTPNKQKSVLAIFKPKSRSKCSSPIELEQRAEALHTNTKSVTPSFKLPGKEHLRYYDTPLDGSSIHIPLHTPPDERDLSKPSTSAASSREAEPPPPPPPPMPPSHGPLVPKGGIKVLPEGPVVLKKASISGETPKPKPLQTLMRQQDVIVQVERSPSEADDWSMEVQRHSSQESQETVISQDQALNQQNQHSINKSKSNTSVENGQITKLVSREPTAREKRHILFTTKLGSGSEEGLFCTQFSVSKTESLCSQLSDQNSVLNSPPEVDAASQQQVNKRDEVVMRPKDSNSNEKRKSHRDFPIVDESALQREKFKEDPSTRFSRCIDQNEILEAQKKLEALRAKKREAKRLEDERQAKEAEEEKVREEAIMKLELTEKQQKNLQLPEQLSDQIVLSGSTDEPGNSSGSEKGSSVSHKTSTKTRLMRDLEENESTGLVLQESFEQESFELPYIPTTLPEERAQGIKLIPMRDRAAFEVKTCPVDRPRSRTPIDPNNLEPLFTVQGSVVEVVKRGSIPSSEGEKLKISLPKRTNSSKERSSDRRISNGANKNDLEQTTMATDDDFPPPPPLPPRKSQPWIDFDNIPEKRKPPKRITTLPTKESEKTTTTTTVVYNYVNPEECQCECHETERETHKTTVSEKESTPSDEAQPLLGERDAFAGPR